jgi:transcriptional regulator with XRE-family HTH domain
MQRATRHVGLGRTRAAELRRRFGSELLLARTAAGLSQVQLARLAGVSQSVVSRAERAARPIDWPTACALAAATGHELGLRLYPSDGVSLRDRGQLAAVEAVVTQAHPSWHPSIEQPIGAGDRRAADLVLRGRDETIHIEVERSLVDLQAQVRAAMLKRAALAEHLGQVVRLVIALPGTRRTRGAVTQVLPLFRTALPMRSSAVWAAIRSGSALGADGILFLPPAKRRHMAQRTQPDVFRG